MCVTNFAKAFEFYTTRCDFKPSDVSTNFSDDFNGNHALTELYHRSWSMAGMGAILLRSFILTVAQRK